MTKKSMQRMRRNWFLRTWKTKKSMQKMRRNCFLRTWKTKKSMQRMRRIWFLRTWKTKKSNMFKIFFADFFCDFYYFTLSLVRLLLLPRFNPFPKFKGCFKLYLRLFDALLRRPLREENAHHYSHDVYLRVLTIMTAHALQKPVEKRGAEIKKSSYPHVFDFFQPLELQNFKKVHIKSFNKFIITRFSQYLNIR